MKLSTNNNTEVARRAILAISVVALFVYMMAQEHYKTKTIAELNNTAHQIEAHLQHERRQRSLEAQAGEGYESYSDVDFIKEDDGTVMAIHTPTGFATTAPNRFDAIMALLDIVESNTEARDDGVLHTADPDAEAEDDGDAEAE